MKISKSRSIFKILPALLQNRDFRWPYFYRPDSGFKLILGFTIPGNSVFTKNSGFFRMFYLRDFLWNVYHDQKNFDEKG